MTDFFFPQKEGAKVSVLLGNWFAEDRLVRGCFLFLEVSVFSAIVSAAVSAGEA